MKKQEFLNFSPAQEWAWALSVHAKATYPLSKYFGGRGVTTKFSEIGGATMLADDADPV